MRRRSLLLASVAGSALGVATAASAADLPVKARPLPPPPVWSWTGFYLGANLGYSWGKSDSTVSFFDATTGTLLASVPGSFDLNGVIGGGQIGYNWQTDSWVWGLEADIQGSGQKGSATFFCGPPCGVPAVSETLNQQIDWFGTVRARLGILVTPTVLLYGTGGLAYGDIETDGIEGDPTVFSTSSVKAGWTAGIGVEGRISGNWTAKLEYLYMDLGHVSGTTATTYSLPICTSNTGPTTCTPPQTLNTSFSSGITDNVVRAGINYKLP